MTLDFTPWTVRNLRGMLRDCAASRQMGYTYSPLGRVANTEIKHMLWEIEHEHDFPHPAPDTYFEVHNKSWEEDSRHRSSPWKLYSRTDVRRLMRDLHGSFLFSVVRNPYTRLLSGYLDKVVSVREAGTAEQRAKRAERYMLPEIPGSFAEFVDMICEQSNYNTNGHWKSQRYRLLYDFLGYRYIGHFETLDDSFAAICEKLGVPPRPRRNRAMNMTEAQALFEEYYTNDLIDKVYRRYRPDFDAFGYAKRPERGLGPRRAMLAPAGLAAHTPALAQMVIALCEGDPAGAREVRGLIEARMSEAGESCRFDPDLELRGRGRGAQAVPPGPIPDPSPAGAEPAGDGQGA